jgi:hypothetical protein
MRKFAKFVARACSAIVALGTAVLTGATLAVVIIEGKLTALSQMSARLGWIMRGRPTAPGEVDETWLLEAEWRIAFFTAISIALISSTMWIVLSWRRHHSYRTAASVGFLVSAAAAGLWFSSEEMLTAVKHCAMIGLVGGALGGFVRATDRALVGYLISEN